MCKLQKQHDYFMQHKSELIRCYKGKFIVISEDLNIKPFDTDDDAYVFGAHVYGLGKFMIKECTEEANASLVIGPIIQSKI